MENLIEHIKDINEEYCATYLADYMNSEWGVTVGYTPTPMHIANMRKDLADTQTANDCCALCAASVLSQPITITQYAVLSANQCSPFAPLSSHGHYHTCFTNQSLNNKPVNGSC